MTIQFECPNCGEIIAFDEKHAGKRARCLKCDQRFIIPDKDFQKPRTIKIKTGPTEPAPGFYKAALFDSPLQLISLKNITAIAFIITVTCVRFFFSHYNVNIQMNAVRIWLPFGHMLNFLCWGILIWYYIETVETTATEVDSLPATELDGGYGFFGKVFKSWYILILAVFALQIPAVILQRMNFSTAAKVLSLVGIFFVPSIIIATRTGSDIVSALRPGCITKPIFRAFGPYFVVAALFIIACQLQMWAGTYGDFRKASRSIIASHLLANLALQLLFLTAARAAGLFYRHHICYFDE